VLNEHVSYMFQCVICLHFRSVYERATACVRRHLDSCDISVPIKCPLCDVQVTNRCMINVHMSEAHPELTAKACCFVCLEFYDKEDEKLRKHILSKHHSAFPTKHLCTLCGNSFSSNTMLKAHIAQVHEKKNSEMCQQCGLTFHSQIKLQKHQREWHCPRAKCLHCDKTLRIGSSDKVLRHLVIHTGLKPYKCAHCNYSTERKTNCALHVKKAHQRAQWAHSDIVTDELAEKTMMKTAHMEMKRMKEGVLIHDAEDISMMKQKTEKKPRRKKQVGTEMDFPNSSTSDL